MGHEDKLALVDIWDELKEEFWKPHKDTVFYRKISSQMILRDKIFSPEQCKYMIDQLQSDFKLYVSGLKKSGQGAPRPWAYYDLLRPILEGRVNVVPQQTFAVGVTTQRSSNPFLKSASPEEQPERVGRARPVPQSSARRDDLKDMFQMIANNKKEAMNELKDIALLLRKT